MVNKKGLSDIVATVLIVLLALAAIAIIWAFIQPTITRGGCQVDQRTKCTMTELEPLACTYEPAGTNKYRPSSTFQLTKGSANKAVIVYEFKDGSSKTTVVDTPPTQAYQSASTTFVSVDDPADIPLRVKVAGTLTDAKCGDTTCDPSTVIVECTKISCGASGETACTGNGCIDIATAPYCNTGANNGKCVPAAQCV